MAHDPRALAIRWFDEVWNRRNEAVIHELLAADSVCHMDDGAICGPDEFHAKQFVPFTAAFSELSLTIEGTVCEGDQVVVRWSATGVHNGEGLGIKATHKPVTFRGMTWVRVKDGKFGEGWQSSNLVEVVRHLTEHAGKMS